MLSAQRWGSMRAMTAPDSSRMRVTIHLVQQTTVSFSAAQMWPLHGAYARFGNDLSSFAEEVTRRLRTEGYVGFAPQTDEITIIPFGAVKRIDFSFNQPDR